jgi:protein SCO1/2
MNRWHVAGAAGAVFLGAAALTALGVARMHAMSASAGPTRSTFVGSTPPPGIHATPFVLRSYRGPRVSLSADRGKVVVLTFLDSTCVDQCPPIAHIIGRAMPRLTAAERRQAVALAISVDPRVDTVANVRTFLRATRATTSLDFLVGPLRGLFDSWKAYHVLSAVATGDANIHSADVMIFNPRGLWVSSLNQGVDLTPTSLVHDIRAALRDTRS